MAATWFLSLAAAGLSAPAEATSAPRAEGTWTGGLWLRGNWVAINVRFAGPAETPGGAADITFPSYGGSESARDVALSQFRQTSDRLHFEIPFDADRVVLDGRHHGSTISGSFAYKGAKGSFGLTAVVDVEIEALSVFYGAYRVSTDRVISILQSGATREP